MEKVKKIKYIKKLSKNPIEANLQLTDKLTEIISVEIRQIGFLYKEIARIKGWLVVLALLLITGIFKFEILSYVKTGVTLVSRLTPDQVFQTFYVVPVTALTTLFFQRLKSRKK